MIDFTTTYIITGAIVSFMLLFKADELGISGDMIISEFEFEEQEFLRQHPNLYKFGVMLVLLAIVFIWPYVLYKLVQEYDKE